MKPLQYLLFAGLLASCAPRNTETDPSIDKKATTVHAVTQQCYRYATVNDTIELKIIQKGDSVTGTLVYMLKEKDKNRGTIQGIMKDGILMADYTFQSEGVQSIRQVVFKKEGNSFVEGYGDFNKLESLAYNTSMQLVNVTCNE